MRITPPTASITLPSFKPSRLPIHTPAAQRAAVIIPMTALANQILTLSSAKAKPTTRASILVAICKSVSPNPIQASAARKKPKR